MSDHGELKKLVQARSDAGWLSMGSISIKKLIALITESEELSLLRDEIIDHRNFYKAWNNERAELKAENEALRNDAERYQWIRTKAELESYGGLDYCLPMIHAWEYKPSPYLNEKFESLDSAIDAAMSEEGS